MKLRIRLAAALVCMVAFGAFAEEQTAPKAEAAHDHGEMMKQMHEAMAKAGTPGDAHKKLDGMVGKWDAKVTMWPMPGMDPMTSTGTSESRWVMGGRYIEQRFSGNVMGMTFDGMGHTGYDNVKKQYFSTWMDSMSTGMMMSTGTMDDDKSFTFTGTMADPMTGKDCTVISKVRVVDADHHHFEMWGPDMQGKNYKMMEIAYTRSK
jgi:hypothetical protein